MQITLEIPEEIAARLGPDLPSLSRAALEGLVFEGFRSGKLSKAEGRQLLGISSRYEMDGFLKEHGYVLPLTMEDLDREAEASKAFREECLSSQTQGPSIT